MHHNHHRRGPWSSNEDNQLLQLVQIHGAHNWVRISSLLGSRTPKQCRERYHQNLKPSLNHDPITPEEGALITKLVLEMGKRWAEIARHLNGRSDNAVKNWWNGGQNRKRRTSATTTSSSSSGLRRDQKTAYRLGNSRQQHRQQQQLGYGGAYSDDNISPFSSPSPRQHNLTINIHPRGQHAEEPMVSPAYTERSTGSFNSEGRTPSLISDTASSLSTSPRVPASPVNQYNTLPPLLNLPQSSCEAYGVRPTDPAIFGHYAQHGNDRLSLFVDACTRVLDARDRGTEGLGIQMKATNDSAGRMSISNILG